MRTVTGENLSDHSQALELLDGMARVLPYGVSNSEFKEMANLLKSYTYNENHLERGGFHYFSFP